jgi:transcriptional regulator with XRE-family HTH domain
MNQAHAALGLAVQRRRKALNLTQDKVAKLSGLHRTYISDVERGVRNLSLESLLKISKSLSMTLSGLFERAGL